MTMVRDELSGTAMLAFGVVFVLLLGEIDLSIGYLAGIGPRLYQHFMTRGFLVRPLGNTIYLMPPYCVTAEELASLAHNHRRLASHEQHERAFRFQGLDDQS